MSTIEATIVPSRFNLLKTALFEAGVMTVRVAPYSAYHRATMNQAPLVRPELVLRIEADSQRQEKLMGIIQAIAPEADLRLISWETPRRFPQFSAAP